MATDSLRDVPLVIRSPGTTSERRISPSWTLSQFKTKLEFITGIPASCQILTLHIPGSAPTALQAENEDSTQLVGWHLQPQAEIEVGDSRPAGIAMTTFTDTSDVPKYSMPQETYEQLSSTVLAWKKANKLGRFDPNIANAASVEVQKMWDEAQSKGIETSRRCQVGGENTRRGKIAYVGEVTEIPGPGGPWVGIILDEPSGKNDGTIGGRKYFTCAPNTGIFVRPDRVEVGDFPILDDDLDQELEEL